MKNDTNNHIVIDTMGQVWFANTDDNLRATPNGLDAIALDLSMDQIQQLAVGRTNKGTPSIVTVDEPLYTPCGFFRVALLLSKTKIDDKMESPVVIGTV